MERRAPDLIGWVHGLSLDAPTCFWQTGGSRQTHFIVNLESNRPSPESMGILPISQSTFCEWIDRSSATQSVSQSVVVVYVTAGNHVWETRLAPGYVPAHPPASLCTCKSVVSYYMPCQPCHAASCRVEQEQGRRQTWPPTPRSTSRSVCCLFTEQTGTGRTGRLNYMYDPNPCVSPEHGLEHETQSITRRATANTHISRGWPARPGRTQEALVVGSCCALAHVQRGRGWEAGGGSPHPCYWESICRERLGRVE